MTTFPQVFNNIGSRVPFTWSEVGPGGLATVDGNNADFASIAGGENFQLARNGGASSVITFLAGDNSLAGVVARINATFPGYAAPDPEGGAVRLQADRVTVVSMDGATFKKIGLPLINKDKTQLTRAYIALESEVQNVDRVDKISNGLAIPAGANEVTLWTKYDLPVLQPECNPIFTIGWSNGTEGEAPNSLLACVTETIVFPAIPQGLSEANPGRGVEVGTALLSMAGAFPDYVTPRMIRVGIPAGATKMYILGLSSGDEMGTGDKPFNAPKLYVAATFGARL